ncbi:MAG: MerR family transcriptional regulator [Candidatus Paceibacterota bacterium]
MKHASLGEIAIKLGINKSKLAYYFNRGLLKPVSKVGAMNVFDADEVIKIVKKINQMKKSGLKLEDIRLSL